MWAIKVQISKIVQSDHSLPCPLTDSTDTNYNDREIWLWLDCADVQAPLSSVLAYDIRAYFSCWTWIYLTLVLLNLEMHCLCKQCRSRSVGFFRSQLIWIFTVCHSVCEFVSTIWIKHSDWLKIWSGCDIFIQHDNGLMQDSDDESPCTVMSLKLILQFHGSMTALSDGIMTEPD